MKIEIGMKIDGKEYGWRTFYETHEVYVALIEFFKEVAGYEIKDEVKEVEND